MKIGLMLRPLSDQYMQLAAQLGATDMVGALPEGDASELILLRSRIEDAGLRLSVIEGGVHMDQIVLGAQGRDAQIEGVKRALQKMAAAAIETLCYNFMVWRPGDGVVRTSMTTRERGGALVSSFDAALLDKGPPLEGESFTDEQMWERLEYFLRRVVPAAEAEGVKLAMHPADPPLSLRGSARILRKVEDFQRLIELVDSPCNGLTFCQGCFAEMGADIPTTIRRFGDRIHFVHFRDVQGQVPAFRETFHDNGKTDMLAAMRAYRDIGFSGVMRPDHAPYLAGDEGANDGYSMLGKIFAVGYMKGLMEAV
ncbi:MAG: TIM barrel protein [Candidatus Latescibacteria bacterium]|nr:TIM barrel protein [Candidatus Latescibacterota bacterium]